MGRGAGRMGMRSPARRTIMRSLGRMSGIRLELKPTPRLRCGAVADVDSSDQVNHIFRDVAGVVADAFQTAGGDEVIEGSLDPVGLGSHHFDGLVLDRG